jgi:hypothetical protein
MSLASLQALQFGLKVEAVRGTAETSPAKWYPILPTPEVSYVPALLEDKSLRAVKAELAPVQGLKIGTGKLKIILDAQTIGEFLNSCLGGCTSVQLGGGAAYKHTFTPSTSKIQNTSYTFFVDYGMAVKKYSMCVVKSLTFTGPVDNLITVDVEFLFKNEAAGSMGTASFPTNRYLSFQNVTYKIANTANTFVKNWSLKVDNGAKALMLLGQSQDIQDIVAAEPLQVSGSMVILYDNETERNKFLANTASAISMLIEGATAAGSYKYTVELPVTAAHYSAYPLGWEDNLLAANVEFKGYHNGTSQFNPYVTNLDTAYTSNTPSASASVSPSSSVSPSASVSPSISPSA